MGRKTAEKRTLKRWKFLCWEMLSKWKRKGGVCFICGKTVGSKKLNAHHLVHKAQGNYAKFEPDNIVPMCGYYCHTMLWHGKMPWDKQRDYIDKWIGLERYWEIRRESHKSHQYKAEDYEKMLKYFTEQYEQEEEEI